MATEISAEDHQAQNPQAVPHDSHDTEGTRAEGAEVSKPHATDLRTSTKEGVVEKPSKQASGAGDSKNANPAKVRKRTKTGCLTCRRRRIKCGEERPTCNNCVKSKRNCEGYTPRVIFKDPLGAYRPSANSAHDSGSHYQPIATHNAVEPHHRQLQPRSAGQMAPPIIAPHSTQHEHQGWTGLNGPALKPFSMVQPYHDESYSRPFDGPMYTQGDLTPRVPQQIAQRNPSLDTSPVSPEIDIFSTRQTGLQSQQHPVHRPDRDSGIDVSYPGLTSEWPHGSISSTMMPGSFPQTPATRELPPSEAQGRNHMQTYTSMARPPRNSSLQSETWQNPKLEPENHQFWSSNIPPATRSHYNQTEIFAPNQHDSSHIKYEPQGHGQQNGNQAPLYVSHHYSDATPRRKESSSRYDPTVPADFDPSIEAPEDENTDVSSDEEQGDPDLTMSDTSTSNLGLMLALSANQGNRGFRSLTNFLNEPNVLSTYRPSWSASPLMDPQTARVFCHFVTATAPTLSLHNRHPTNPSVMFTGAPVPVFQRSLFTYTLPMMALTNQGLLHAQLALASLHIAKLQQTSPTPSLKHYHYALRRVAKAVGHPTKRREIATLAATLLLGFFEVTTAEHNKWNSHLAGARELILEIDFAGMTKRINAYKAETDMMRKGGMYNYGYEQRYDNQRRMSFDILRTDKEIDENLVSILMGYRTRYDEYGQITEMSEPPSHYHLPLTPKDVENFEIQCDLYWWYAKQDMYQSLISGNRLLLSYDRWSHCPPRAPVGRLDAVYGSLDHLILLFARLTDFAARDLARKIKVQAKAEEDKKKAASRWNPSQGSPPTPNGQQPSHRPPPMYGMMPAPGYIHLPAAFDQSHHDHLNEANKVIVKDAELDAATEAAEREWSDIYAALDLLEGAFGPDFQSLSADHMAPLSTPFGPALYYRTYSIACLWSLFFTARIFATRVAPSMPPAAMVAAGVAAQQTARWANTIGRICAGLQPVSTTAPLNPSHGAALMDSCMGLFHAGVQFRDAAERGWTITKLRDIARLTGWQTAALIASGCERAWMAAAEMGKGPAYTRTMNATAKDDRVSGRSRVPNPGPPKDNNDRRFIRVNPGTRVYWALGILGAEEDMKQLKLD
ncbi:MAG: hypothetical protein Q9225_003693 [Loekoesia sp. 1 TL-2023]